LGNGSHGESTPVNPIDVIINAVWRGRDAIERAKRDIGGIEGAAEKGLDGLVALAQATAVVTAGLYGASKVASAFLRALDRGAGLELTEQRFNRLAKSIGTTGEALRTNLNTATAGLLSNSQQMALVTDLVALGLANDADQAVRLSRVVTELDQDMGQLTLALANQSVKRFDQLGVSLVGFKDKLEDLKGTMSDEDAFTMAFLQQAEEQIERVGGVAGTTAGDIRRLRADWNDLKDAVSQDLAREAGPILAELSGRADQERLAAVESAARIAQSATEIAAAVAEFRDALPDAPILDEEEIQVARIIAADLARVTGSAQEFGAEFQRIFGGDVPVILKLLGQESTATFYEFARAVDAAESSDRALLNTQRELNEELADATEQLELFIQLATTEHKEAFFQRMLDDVMRFGQELEDLNRIAREGLPDRVGAEAAETGQAVIAALEQTQLDARADLFADFQDDLSSITEREEQRRASITEQYESQRTAIVEAYNLARLREEEDWLRHLQRLEEQYQQNIIDIRENAAEAAADARENANERLEDLERDHLQRMQDIIDNAELQLEDAAGRLDAAAVARIIRNRDAALEREQENYQEQRQNIEEALQEQLEAIQGNMEERLEDLEEFHEERLAREEEDRRIRLQRLEEDHRRRLAELDRQQQDRMNQLRREYEQERRERTQQYIDERNQLMMHWIDRQEQEEFYRDELLRQEAEWWQQRIDLIGGGDTGDVPGGGDGGGTGPERPSRSELERLAIAQMELAGWTDNMIFDMLRQFRNWTDAQLAQWIEDTFDYDVPGYRAGIDRVPHTGLAVLHQDEAVLSAPVAAQYRAGKLGNTMSITNNVYPAPGMDEAMLARKVEKATERAMTKLFERMAA
jgi:hypothetical protein